VRISALLCVGDDGAAEEALAGELADMTGARARLIGSPREQPRGWEAALRAQHGCLLEAGGQVDDAFSEGSFPVLIAGTCSVCITTIPSVLRHRPAARVLWLDAHGDFNTPDTTPSQFLGGMCLSAACGVWDAGFDGQHLDPSRIVTYGVRDLDGGEQVLLETNGVGRATRPRTVVEALRGHEVFVHLDCDVLDPELMPGAAYPAPGGITDGDLRAVLEQVATESTVVGVEVTALADAHHATMVAACVEPLLEHAIATEA
jgi:arginase family enzyme